MILAAELDLQDGIHPGTTRERYERIQAVNFSTLKHFKRSAMHAREEMTHPSPPTEEMEFGTAFHCAVLEPERFGSEYVKAPVCDRRTTVGKRTWADFEAMNHDRTVLAAADMDCVEDMAAAVRAHPLVKDLLAAPGANELCAIWTDAETGLRCKCLIDSIRSYTSRTFVIDLKSAADATPWMFGAAAAKLSYHVQAAWYLGGLDVLAPVPREWLWVAVEKKRPYGVAVYRANEDVLSVGRMLARGYLRQFAECQKTNLWPGYPVETHDLRLPRWADIDIEE